MICHSIVNTSVSHFYSVSFCHESEREKERGVKGLLIFLKIELKKKSMLIENTLRGYDLLGGLGARRSTVNFMKGQF